MSSIPDPFSIELSHRAIRDVEHLSPTVTERILREIQGRLSSRPFEERKTRIKRLTGILPPLYRLRVGDYRVYYRIMEKRVVVLGILHKKDSQRWLKKQI